MAASEAWICPTCQSAVRTAHCPLCGERRRRADELTLTGLLTQAAQSLSSVDGRLLRSFRALLTRPGVLTAAYLSGSRKPYIGPFQLFLIANAIFFAVQSLSGATVFSTSLQSHLSAQDWSAFAQRLVTARLEASHIALAGYAPVFDHAVAVNAKTLVILMVLPFALLLLALFGRRQPFVAHLVFALYFYAFLLLCFSALIALAALETYFGGAGLSSASIDKGLFAIMLLAGAVYLRNATTIVYDAKGSARALTVLVLTVAIAAGVLEYRILIFVITALRTLP